MDGELTTSIDSDHASFIITLPDEGGKETYFIDKVPEPGSTLVLAARQEILNDLDLHEMLNSLSRVSDLLFLAYCGVAGTHIQAGIADRRKTFLDLCADCVTTMNTFQASASQVAKNLAEAFHWIVNGQETRAIDVFARAGKKATDMAAASKALADRFAALGENVQKDHHDTIDASATEQDTLAKLRQQQEEMQALWENQSKKSEELAASIQNLQALYEDAKSREAEASKRAFITGIVSAVTGAVGSAFGAYSAVKNPLGTAASNLSRRDGERGRSDDDKDGKKPTAQPKPGLSTADQARLDAATKARDDAEAAYESAKKAFEAAQKAKPDPAKEGTKPADASLALDDARTAQAEAKRKRDAAQKKLDELKAELKPDDGAGSAAAAAGFDSASKSTQKMADDAQAAADSVRVEKLRLLDKKLEQEAERREAVSKAAELTSRLGASHTEQQIHESAQAALQLAVWAFANISTTLMLARHFWENVAKACERLGDGEIKQKIQDELKYDTNADARRDYFRSDMFLPGAVGYLARWKALAVLGDEYRLSAIAARDQTVDSIDAAPTIEEAQLLLLPLRLKVEGQLDAEHQSSEQRTAAVREELKLLQSAA